MFLPTGYNGDSRSKKAKTKTDGNVSSSDRNLSKVPPGEEMNRMCAVLNFSNAIAGPIIGLMQQMELLSVEISGTQREMMTWLGFSISNTFSWALHPKSLKGNFTRVHRVCMARAVADHAVDRVLDSFSRHKEFNRGFDECTYALEMNAIEPSGVVKFTQTALRQTMDLQFFILSQAIITDLKVFSLSIIQTHQRVNTHFIYKSMNKSCDTCIRSNPSPFLGADRAVRVAATAGEEEGVRPVFGLRREAAYLDPRNRHQQRHPHASCAIHAVFDELRDEPEQRFSVHFKPVHSINGVL